jgi:chromosome segregation ATPase
VTSDLDVVFAAHREKSREFQKVQLERQELSEQIIQLKRLNEDLAAQVHRYHQTEAQPSPLYQKIKDLQNQLQTAELTKTEALRQKQETQSTITRVLEITSDFFDTQFGNVTELAAYLRQQSPYSKVLTKIKKQSVQIRQLKEDADNQQKASAVVAKTVTDLKGEELKLNQKIDQLNHEKERLFEAQRETACIVKRALFTMHRLGSLM